MFERTQKRTKAIPLTSLIDVVFLLIVFFMLSTSFVMSESMELWLPSEQAGAADDASMRDVPFTMEVQVQKDGYLVHNESRFDVVEFQQWVKTRLEDNPNQPFVLMADAGVSVQQLVGAMDVAYAQGARQVRMDYVNKDIATFTEVGQQ